MKEINEEEKENIAKEENIIQEIKIEQRPQVSWREEALKGNFMPAMIMLENKRINVNEIIQPLTQETLLLIAGRFGYFNVLRTLIEKFKADINYKNINGHSLLFLIVSTTNGNLVHFHYLISQNNLEIDIIDKHGMSPLSHSIMTNFHFPFIYFVNAGLLNKIKDSFGNNVIYFALANNNKFALDYLINNKKFDLSYKYFNNTQTLGDLLITNQYNSMTKFLVKYYWNLIDINSIICCRKNILSYNVYNIYNYELLNTLYYFKKGNYSEFLYAIFRKNNIDKEKNMLNEDINNIKLLPQNNYGYYYKYINLRMMFYNLILPTLPSLYKFIFLFIYFSLIYFITNEKNNPENENPRTSNYKYELCSISLLNIIIILLFNSKINIIPKIKNNFEEEISNKLKSNLRELPDIEEICPACGHIKDISIIHCHLCKGCVPRKLFHSNLFGCCISKSNIGEYLLYIIFKINFYYICLMNLLKANPTNNLIRCALVPFRHKTTIKIFFVQSYLLAIMIINIGQLINILFSISVKTPYKYIYGMDKRVYYKGLQQNQVTKGIVQVPEINENKKIKNILSFLFSYDSN